MGDKRVVTIIIKADGSQAKEEISELNDGLSELDFKQAKAVLETLKSLNNVDLSSVKAAIKEIDNAGLNKIKSQADSAGASLNKAAQLVLKFDNQLGKLREREGELAKLNRTLSQDGVAAGIDGTTKALLRQKAALVDQATQSNQNSKNGIGSFVGSVVAANLISTATSKAISLAKDLATEIKDLGVETIQTSAKLEQTTNALIVFTGSGRRAKQEIYEIDEAARNTPGLRLESAEEGFTRLRALGFAAETSRKLVVGLAKQKLIANVDEGAINRVIVNLTQLSAGSTRASQDLRETIQAIPSLRPVLEDAFGSFDPKRIGAFFKNNPEEALKKFADALEKAKSPAGGLNNSLDKLYDSFIEIERIVGEPILDPLSTSVEKLTGLVRENQSVWQKLGNQIGDTIRGANFTFDEIQKRNPQSAYGKFEFKLASFFGYESVADFDAAVEKAFKPIGADRDLEKRIGITPLAEIGKNAREQLERQELAAKFAQNPNVLRSDNTIDFNALKSINKTPSELAADALNAERLANRQREVARQENIVSLQYSSKEAEQILKNRFDVEKALLDSSVRYTSEQEKQYIQQSFQLKNRSIQAEIALQTGRFNKEIALNEGNTQEIAKLESDKNFTVRNLNNELKINSINNLKEIRAAEIKSFEEKRQSSIQFQNLEIQQLNFQSNNQITEIKRQISQRNNFADEGFSRLKEITTSNYEQILQATSNSRFRKIILVKKIK